MNKKFKVYEYLLKAHQIFKSKVNNAPDKLLESGGKRYYKKKFTIESVGRA